MTVSAIQSSLHGQVYPTSSCLHSRRLSQCSRGHGGSGRSSFCLPGRLKKKVANISCLRINETPNRSEKDGVNSLAPRPAAARAVIATSSSSCQILGSEGQFAQSVVRGRQLPGPESYRISNGPNRSSKLRITKYHELTDRRPRREILGK